MGATTRSGKREDVSQLSEDDRPVDQVAGSASDEQQDSSGPPDTGALGQHVNEVIKTISRLQSLGLQRLKIPLPKCIVLGEQSAGKSSVIEAISGIKTPRSDDTCTRCPLFISLESSEDPRAHWSASVSLRLDYTYDGNSGRDRRFRGWCPLPQPNIIHFATTENPNELEFFIARAQLATLSPHIDHEVFLRPSLAGLREDKDEDQRCAFSPNIVCISITQPGLPALSFYDLPGIIGQAESEENQFVVKFVSDLVTDYVKDPETLILLCCSLETDIANSTAGGIARRLKATNRCIGVLTKPDRLPPGSRHDKLMEVFEQKRFALGHGYFVVKNLGQDEINQRLTHQEARAREREFFFSDKNLIWSTTFKSYAHRFGTVNLQRFLSQKLAEHIMKKLPIIEQEIDARLHQVETTLQHFPEPPTHNANRIVSDVILDFSQEVRQEIEAQWPCKTWRNNWKAVQKSFFDELASMKPTLTTRGREDESVYSDVQAALPGSCAKEPIPISDSDNDGDEPNDGDSETVASVSQSPKKKRKLEERTPTPGQREGAGNIPTTDFSVFRKGFQLDQVRQHLIENSQSKIPGQIEPRVINSMMLEAMEHWNKPLDHFFTVLENKIRSQVEAIYQKHFRSREGSAFHVETWKIVEHLLAHHMFGPNKTMAVDSLKDEKEGPYIFHEDTFEAEKKETLEYYQQHRISSRLNLYKRKKVQRTQKPVTPAEEEKVKKHCMSVLRFEPYELEVGVVAQVTTYYMLAARRFHDSVCMRIESHLHKKLATELRKELEDRLGIKDEQHGHDNAVRLLAEPSHRYNQRKELLGQRNSLIQGQKVLQDLQQKYGVGAPVAAKAEDVDTA